eukprot:CAMPEP_0171067034 /NCGR_PEP_ID=MMETSP0766_2-20121228/7763_1 /TAXON_ID=439317 /ORGANISM="Gambierdiscus australes, Strain CAWD 149" /LENGTH=126 /DNA_ID=CAMNT_0011523243 /DNA_START=117 /DNA_END=497 /DNA_ORIENTATION=+
MTGGALEGTSCGPGVSEKHDSQHLSQDVQVPHEQQRQRGLFSSEDVHESCPVHGCQPCSLSASVGLASQASWRRSLPTLPPRAAIFAFCKLVHAQRITGGVDAHCNLKKVTLFRMRVACTLKHYTF